MKEVVDFYYRIYPYGQKFGPKYLKSLFYHRDLIKNGEEISSSISSGNDNNNLEAEDQDELDDFVISESYDYR